jgi:hypothetical protein
VATKPQSDPRNRYYTSPQRAGALHDDFRLLWEHVYRLSDQLSDAHKQIAAMKSSGSDAPTATATKGVKATAPKPPQGSPSNTTINGLYVAATPPNDGDRLTYDAASGQIIWAP